METPLAECTDALRGLVMHLEHHANGRLIDPQTVAGPAFFRMADVIRITALSRATLYRRIAGGKFPLPCTWEGAPVDGRVQRFKIGSTIPRDMSQAMQHQLEERHSEPSGTAYEWRLVGWSINSAISCRTRGA